MTNRIDRVAASLRIVCAMLLLFAGMAHRPAMAAQADIQNFVAYVLPDGTVASLCVPGEVDGKPGKFVLHGCEACRIAASVMLPGPPADAVAIRRHQIANDYPVAASGLPFSHMRPSAPARGPPSDIV